FNIFLPGDIKPKNLKTDKRLLLFAADICIPVLMDTSGLFVSSAALLEERMRTLVNLIDADPGSKELYSAEVAELRLQKVIKSGMEIVDSNRGSVDMDALTRWANKRYRESYLRYQALRVAGVGLSVNFDEVIKEIQRHSHADGEYFTIPKNEADTLLLEVI